MKEKRKLSRELKNWLCNEPIAVFIFLMYLCLKQYHSRAYFLIGGFNISRQEIKYYLSSNIRLKFNIVLLS